MTFENLERPADSGEVQRQRDQLGLGTAADWP